MTPFLSPLPAVDVHEFLRRSAVWTPLRGARILITGGTGFIGQHLVESLLIANESLGLDVSITLLSRKPQAVLAQRPHWNHSCVHWLTGDIRDVIWPDEPFSHVLHAATDASPAAQADALGLIDQVVGGTRRLLEWAVSHGVGRLLYISSGAVYGELPADAVPVVETHAGAADCMSPTTAYAQAKRMAEHLCVQYAQRWPLSVSSARCFAFVGPGLPLAANFAIGNFIAAALAGRPLRIHSDGRPQRSYLYTADLALWLWTLLFRGENGCAYHVGSDQPLSIAALAHLVADTLAPGLAVEIEGATGGGRHHYVPAIDRCRALGLDVWTPLPEAILRTAQSITHPPHGLCVGK